MPVPTPPPVRLAPEPRWHLSRHALKVCADKGFSPTAVLAAAVRPSITYESGRVPGQYRHISGAIVAVVDPIALKVITAYMNVTETALRADQTDDDAQAHAAARR